ncbi:hypothetical protein GCM10022243_64850 [Saccharothrix violaceirubra]|uniref:Uncharacterized protein n=1 Tax=Saccharothrix violaceirubra TaxID=413306 RepID=A0A7W7T9G9_9PSEU|nr:hypothetical protein [Saccharothrix violaceirubra]
MTPSRVAFAALVLLTISNQPSAVTIGAAGLSVLVAVHAVLYVTHPFTRCRTCTGSGKRRSGLVRAYRYCPRCGGTGLRLRAGRRVWIAITRNRRNR